VVAEAVEGDWPPEATRCPHCRLMIGVGRAREEGDGAPGARGAAAGESILITRRGKPHLRLTAATQQVSLAA